MIRRWILYQISRIHISISIVRLDSNIFNSWDSISGSAGRISTSTLDKLKTNQCNIKIGTLVIIKDDTLSLNWLTEKDEQLAPNDVTRVMTLGTSTAIRHFVIISYIISNDLVDSVMGCRDICGHKRSPSALILKLSV